MKKNKKLLRFARVFVGLAPVLIFVAVFIHSKLPANQGEFAQNHYFLILAASIMFANLFFVLGLLMLASSHSVKEKVILAYSAILGTPVFVLMVFVFLEIFAPF